MSAAYQNLFDYMYDEYGVILLQNEIQEIVRRVKLDEEQDNCNLPHVSKSESIEREGSVADYCHCNGKASTTISNLCSVCRKYKY